MKTVFMGALLVLGTLIQSNISHAWESRFNSDRDWSRRNNDWRDHDNDWSNRHHDRTIYYCVVESNFDGPFSGTGDTRLEAQTNAQQACQMGSRSNGFFCNDSAECDSTN